MFFRLPEVELHRGAVKFSYHVVILSHFAVVRGSSYFFFFASPWPQHGKRKLMLTSFHSYKKMNSEFGVKRTATTVTAY
jgi:hypothetical protein